MRHANRANAASWVEAVPRVLPTVLAMVASTPLDLLCISWVLDMCTPKQLSRLTLLQLGQAVGPAAEGQHGGQRLPPAAIILVLGSTLLLNPIPVGQAPLAAVRSQWRRELQSLLCQILHQPAQSKTCSSHDTATLSTPVRVGGAPIAGSVKASNTGALSAGGWELF